MYRWSWMPFSSGVSLLSLVLAAESVPPAPQRILPPPWTADLLDIFFDDAREELVGERPAQDGADLSGSTGASPPTAVDSQVAAGGAVVWSELIDGETLVSEVKRLVAELHAPLATPSRFKSGGYRQCRSIFNSLAATFAVIAQYDREIRWQGAAAGLRDAAARSAASCTVGADESLADAQQRKMQLDDLVRGQTARLPGSPAVEDWSDVADRQLLMEAMEISVQQRLTPAMASRRELTRRAADVSQHAQVIAMLAVVIRIEGFDNWDDKPFQDYAAALRDSAINLNRAAGEENHEAARAALGDLERACTDCHAAYRG